MIVASVNDCNGFDVGVTSGGFVSEEELKHTAVALLVQPRPCQVLYVFSSIEANL